MIVCDFDMKAVLDREQTCEQYILTLSEADDVSIVVKILESKYSLVCLAKKKIPKAVIVRMIKIHTIFKKMMSNRNVIEHS